MRFIADANIFGLESFDINSNMYFKITNANMFGLENVNANKD